MALYMLILMLPISASPLPSPVRSDSLVDSRHPTPSVWRVLFRYGCVLGILLPLIWVGVRGIASSELAQPAYVPMPEQATDTFIPTPNQPPVFTRGSGTR